MEFVTVVVPFLILLPMAILAFAIPIALFIAIIYLIKYLKNKTE